MPERTRARTTAARRRRYFARPAAGYSGATTWSMLGAKDAFSATATWTSTSIAPTQFGLLLLNIENSTDTDPTSITGTSGLVWTKIGRRYQAAGTAGGAMYWAIAGSSNTGTVVMNWAGANTGAISIFQCLVRGLNTAAPIKQFKLGDLTTDAGLNTAPKVVLDTAPGTGPVFGTGFCTNTTPVWTLGGGMSEPGTSLNVANKSTESGYKNSSTATTTVQFTTNAGINWQCIGIEIDATQ